MSHKLVGEFGVYTTTLMVALHAFYQKKFFSTFYACWTQGEAICCTIEKISIHSQILKRNIQFDSLHEWIHNHFQW
jgi:hypothetical protein